MRRSAVVPLVALALAASACGSADGDDGREVRPVTTADPEIAFAPLVHLHAREPWFPLGARRFLRHSTLEWSSRACFFEVNVAAGPISQRATGEGAPALDPRRLGGAPAYRHRPVGADCQRRRGATYRTTQHTRPYDADDRPPGLPVYEGFFLDLLRKAYRGERRLVRRAGQTRLVGVPAYFERGAARIDGRPALRLTYWLLYGRGETVQRDGEPVSWHEGDWERVDVLLRRSGRSDRYLPLALRHYVGDRQRTVPWHEVDLVGDRGRGATATHPVVLSARASHTPYLRAGRYERRARSGYDGEWKVALDEARACSECPRWRTWDSLRDVRGEPWYGFGGGWGVRSLSDVSSGPLGPSPFVR